MKTMIFDCDGLIADTFEVSVDAGYNISKGLGYDFTKQEIRYNVRSYGMEELVKKFNLSKFHIPVMAWLMKRELKNKMGRVEPFKGIDVVLKDFKRKNYNIFLLTSNNKDNVDEFLKKHDLDLFDHKYYNSSVFGKDKKLTKIIKRNNLDMDKLYYIGDEVRDVRACNKINCKVIAATWGYNKKEILQRENPDYIVETPLDLLKF